MVVPATIPLTTPVDALMVAAAVLDELHVPPAVVLANGEVEFTKTVDEPVIAANTGNGLTVTTAVCVLTQVLKPDKEQVIVAVPALTPVTTPVFASTVATATLSLLHTLTGK